MSIYINEVRTCDWVSEIVYEIMKQSSLREIKRRRFLTALWGTAISYTVMIGGQILRAMEVVTF